MATSYDIIFHDDIIHRVRRSSFAMELECKSQKTKWAHYTTKHSQPRNDKVGSRTPFFGLRLTPGLSPPRSRGRALLTPKAPGRLRERLELGLRRRTGSGLAAANEKGRIAIRVQLDDGPRPLGGGATPRPTAP